MPTQFNPASGLTWIESLQPPQEGDAFWDEATKSFHRFDGKKWERWTHDISWHIEKMQQQQKVLAQFTGGEKLI